MNKKEFFASTRIILVAQIFEKDSSIDLGINKVTSKHSLQKATLMSTMGGQGSKIASTDHEAFLIMKHSCKRQIRGKVSV